MVDMEDEEGQCSICLLHVDRKPFYQEPVSQVCCPSALAPRGRGREGEGEGERDGIHKPLLRCKKILHNIEMCGRGGRTIGLSRPNCHGILLR